MVKELIGISIKTKRRYDFILVVIILFDGKALFLIFNGKGLNKLE